MPAQAVGVKSRRQQQQKQHSSTVLSIFNSSNHIHAGLQALKVRPHHWHSMVTKADCKCITNCQGNITMTGRNHCR